MTDPRDDGPPDDDGLHGAEIDHLYGGDDDEHEGMAWDAPDEEDE